MSLGPLIGRSFVFPGARNVLVEVRKLLGYAHCVLLPCRRRAASSRAYVLSESSLFVYPDRLVLKTCGTTVLLAAVPMLLDLAASLDMRPSNFKYSRASFLFPEKQVTLHITSSSRLKTSNAALFCVPTSI